MSLAQVLKEKQYLYSQQIQTANLYCLSSIMFIYALLARISSISYIQNDTCQKLYHDVLSSMF